MKRLLLTPVLVLSLAAPAAAEDKPSLGVKLTDCTTSLDAAGRAAAFTATMPAADGATGLAMRFVLQQRDGALWRKVAVPGWNRYEKADPGAAGFAYSKRIEQLDAPATYRAQVTFRWTSAEGRVVRRAVRTSSSCRQPDLRPDLEATKLTTAAEPDGRTRYTVLVRNAGRGDALAPFGIALSVGTAEQPRQVLPDLQAGGTATLTWVGPACSPGERLAVEVDDADAVDEADEDDDVLSRRC